MGKIDGKDGFIVTANTKICNEHFAVNDILKVPGGTRCWLKNNALPLKVGLPLFETTRKRPAIRTNKAATMKTKLQVPVKPSTQCQPASLVSSALAVVNKVYKAIKLENIETKCKLGQVQRDLKTTKVKLQEKTFGMNTIKSNNDLCQHYTGFPDYERL